VNLLIVEDHAISRKLLRVQLEAEGHSVIEATDGCGALRVLRQRGVDGVISDILMPGMDGFRLCHEIRARGEQTQRVKIILYTGTFVTAADQELALSLGADGFIRKPASPAVILGALQEGGNKVARSTLPSAGLAEMGVLKNYNSALVRKLEERTAELQQSLAQIHRAHDEILELNHTLESREAQRTAAHEAVNLELESMSRTVVQELCEPLKCISTRVLRLEHAAAVTADPVYQEDAAQIAAALQRIEQVVETLGSFVRLGSVPVARELVELDPLVDEVLLAVRAEKAAHHVQWERHTLPCVQGDASLLREVLVCLVGNAVRCTRGRDPAIVEIGSRRERSNEIVIFIRDNGIALEARSSPDSPSGETQLRLAKALRIVARHGGRLWSEAAVGRGTAYFFSLPQANGQDTHH